MGSWWSKALKLLLPSLFGAAPRLVNVELVHLDLHLDRPALNAAPVATHPASGRDTA